MKNQMTREYLYHSIKMDEELYHHGVLGMSWGDRNGPPYPLSGSAKKIARAEAKKKVEQQKRLEKMRKMAAKKRKQLAKAEKEQQKINKKKAKILQKNDLKALQKNKKWFTNEEIQYAVERNQALLDAKYAPDLKNAPDPRAGEKLMNILTKLGMAANAVQPMVGLAKGIAELKKMDTDQKVKDLDRADDALKFRYDLLRSADPEGAVDLLNRAWGTNYSYKNSVKDKIDMIKAISAQIDAESKKDEPDAARIQELSNRMLEIRV